MHRMPRRPQPRSQIVSSRAGFSPRSANLSTRKKVMYVNVVHADWSVALYCQRCGKIHIHDISYFAQRSSGTVLRCGCNYPQATLVRTDRSLFEIHIPCLVCNCVHIARYKSRQLLKTKVEKIYCAKDRFELGYIGKRARIEEILAFNKRQFERVSGDESEEQIEKQQILLEALNRIHDIAEAGGIHCACGHSEISADLLGNSIVLECCRCSSYRILPAKSERDLQRLDEAGYIELNPGRFLIKNIDLD